MKFRTRSSAKPIQGYALAITMCFTAAMLITFAGMLSWSSSNSMLTERNNLYSQSEIAAESATEKPLAAMINDFNNNTALGSASYYSALIPATNGWPVTYSFQDTNGNANQVSVSVGPFTYTPNVPGQLPGIYGQGSDVTIVAEASPIGQRYNMTGKVSQTAWFGIIPLFQFAIFYNMDLEINPGSAMTVNGRVHSNQNLYASGSSSSSPLTFGSSVDAALMATNHSGPEDPQNNRGGNVLYSNTNYPLQHYGTFNLSIGGSSTNANASNPTNVLAVLNPPPSTYSPGSSYNAAYYSSNGQAYFANDADLIITNAYNGTNGTKGTNLMVFYQNPNNSSSPLTYIPPDITNVVSGATNTYYSFVTNGAYYDYRESATVQSVDINVGSLSTWMANKGASYDNQNTTGSTSKGHHINSIYVYNSVPLTGTQLPAVRMLNGQQLPASGLTVVTPDPLYVKGNYNITTNGTKFSTALGDVTNTLPAALLGDAITLLSSNWSDSYNSSTLLSLRTPANTTLNAATLEGIVPSNGSSYSGGVENFLRLLENWSGKTIYYNGSIVVMFPSQYATNHWASGYYSVPTRQWGFDLNFTNQSGLPPLTPRAKALFRASWSAN